jgi:TonB family protein
VQLTAGTPQVSGYLSAEQINRVVRANQAALRYCYESEVQRQRGLKGKVMIQWRVDRAGLVPTARVASSTLNNSGVEGCIVRQIRKWHFPKPDGGEVSVMYPFIFGVGG